MENANTTDSSNGEAPLYVDRGEYPRSGDGREIELLNHVFSRPDIEEIRGSPRKVLDAIDEYGQTKQFLINVGPPKGKLITDMIAEAVPETMIELGGYCGYSAILFGDALFRAGGKRYISLEINAEYADIASRFVDLAGLQDKIEIIVGRTDQSLYKLYKSGDVKRIDFLFLDHYKPAYTLDLKLCEQLGLVSEGCLLIADNVIVPGNPPYLEYVRSSTKEKREKAKETVQDYSMEKFGDPATGCASSEDKLGLNITGNPNLIYESKLVESVEPSGEPDALEVTRCVGVDTST